MYTYTHTYTQTYKHTHTHTHTHNVVYSAASPTSPSDDAVAAAAVGVAEPELSPPHTAVLAMWIRTTLRVYKYIYVYICIYVYIYVSHNIYMYILYVDSYHTVRHGVRAYEYVCVCVRERVCVPHGRPLLRVAVERIL